MTPEPPAPKPARKITPLWKRLPLIVLGLFGVWLWQGGAGIVAIERSLVWKVPGKYASVRKIEAQLWDGEELLTRIELDTPNGLTLDPDRRLPLKPGHYRSALLVWRDLQAPPEVFRLEVDVGKEPTVVIR